MIGCTFDVHYKTQVMDLVSGKPVKESPWIKNLVLDNGLNNLAGGATIAGNFSYLNVGSGTNPTSYASGAVTFTQSGNTITASTGFFSNSPSMVNGLFKWGTGSGGVETYILSFISATQVTVDTSATITTPSVATVWMVQQTALQTFIKGANSIITTSGACFTTFSGNTMTMQRTFMFNQQSGTYNVNEISWCQNSGQGNVAYGRVVLPSTDVVGPTNFYVVIIAITVTWTPAAPIAAANVGTGINSAGTLMIEDFLAAQVNSSGVTTGGQLEVGTGSPHVALITSSYSQNSSLTNSSSLSVGSVIDIGGVGTKTRITGGLPGLYSETISPGTVTATGQTVYGVAMTLSSGSLVVIWDVLFTTPATLPNGSYIPSVTLQWTYGRTLSN